MPGKRVTDIGECDRSHRWDDPRGLAFGKRQLEGRLLRVLQTENDPRLMEQPCRYQFEPYAGAPT